MATHFVTPINSDGVYLTGTPLPIDDLPQVLTYTGALVSTITVEYYGNSYVKTYTYTGSNATAISGWVLQ